MPVIISEDNNKKDEISFQLKYTYPFDLFFKVIPNLGYKSTTDGDINRHRPSLYENRLSDINEKMVLLAQTHGNLIKIINEINSRYDDKILELQAEEWVSLKMFTSYFLHISKSIFYIYARVFSIVYPKLNLNESFAKQIDKINIVPTNSDTNPYINFINLVKTKSWTKDILTHERKTSMRDLDTHFSSIKIDIFPNKQLKKYNFNIHISYGIDSFMPKTTHKANLNTFIDETYKGFFDLADQFTIMFSKEIILSLLK